MNGRKQYNHHHKNTARDLDEIYHKAVKRDKRKEPENHYGSKPA
jgi:hypothetical protein